MRYFLLYLFLFCSLYVSSAQNYDQKFLDSLPEDVGLNLLKKQFEDEEFRQPQYRKPSSSIKKPGIISDRFGSNLFSTMQSTFMPVNEPNIDGSYVLDYGDELELHLTGTESSTTRLVIPRNGTITIKELGLINVSGLSLTQASDIIEAKAREAFLNTSAFLTLVKIRDIQVLIMGNVYSPGSYVLSGNSNALHALNVAGGPSEAGSFRRITVSRGNKEVENIDLYKTFITGKASYSSRLVSGDIVFVHPFINIVSIGGGVKRPGEYELTEEEDLSTAIQFANGLSREANINKINLERISNGAIISKDFTKLSDLNLMRSQDGDFITIGKNEFVSVEIQGSIIRPGKYLMNEGEGIKHLVSKAGGYKKYANPFGGIYLNETALALGQQAKKDLEKQALEKINNNPITVDNKYMPNRYIPIEVPQKLGRYSALGRLKAEFNLDLLTADPSLDVILEEGDKVIIPSTINQVFIYGSVSSEGPIKYLSGKDFNYYIDLRGGLLSKANKKEIFILHPDGSSKRVRLTKSIFKRTLKDNMIYPGSIILVPEEHSTIEPKLRMAEIYTSILSSLGLSLASLTLIGDR